MLKSQCVVTSMLIPNEANVICGMHPDVRILPHNYLTMISNGKGFDEQVANYMPKNILKTHG